jgi:hypothetical protein
MSVSDFCILFRRFRINTRLSAVSILNIEIVKEVMC